MKKLVQLRNGQRAQIVHVPIAALATGFHYYGQTERGEYHFWCESGHWRENRTEHPLDIVRGLHVPLDADAQHPQPKPQGGAS